jgi:hypothetical protein
LVFKEINGILKTKSLGRKKAELLTGGLQDIGLGLQNIAFKNPFPSTRIAEISK